MGGFEYEILDGGTSALLCPATGLLPGVSTTSRQRYVWAPSLRHAAHGGCANRYTLQQSWWCPNSRRFLTLHRHDVFINSQCFLDRSAPVQIGSRTQFGYQVTLITGGHELAMRGL